jgi:hypothetical protein
VLVHTRDDFARYRNLPAETLSYAYQDLGAIPAYNNHLGIGSPAMRLCYCRLDPLRPQCMSRSSLTPEKVEYERILTDLGPQGAIRLLLGGLPAGHSREIVCYFAVRDIVRSSPSFCCFLLYRAQRSSLVSLREVRAKLAAVAHHTHFPTLTNAPTEGGTWSGTPNDTEEPDTTKQLDIPVRVHHPTQCLIGDPSPLIPH